MTVHEYRCDRCARTVTSELDIEVLGLCWATGRLRRVPPDIDPPPGIDLTMWRRDICGGQLRR